MKKLLKFTSYTLSISMCFFAGCSSEDTPNSFDCGTSDLDLVVSASVAPTSCSSTDGSVTVLATGGVEPYQYKIDNGAFGSSNVFNSLGAGTFTVTVKDKNECTVEVSETLVLPGANPLSATAITTPDTECFSNNGTITVNASGGSGSYEYKLGSGAFGSTAVLSGVSNGSNTVTVKDSEGCTITISVNVTRGNTGITYNGEIKALFIAKCQFAGCHPDNGDWFTYTTAKNNAAAIKSRTASGSMPRSPQPGGSLSAEEKAIIACWVDDGAPQN